MFRTSNKWVLFGFWSIFSDFQDIFDVDHFINSLRDEVRILKELPPKWKQRFDENKGISLAPVSWSDLSYYQNQVSLVLRVRSSLLDDPCIFSLLN